MHAKRIYRVRSKPFPLVMKFPNPARPRPVAPLQFPYGLRAESCLVIAGVVKAAPELETIWMDGVFPIDIVELLPRRSAKNDGLFNSDLVHILDPLGNVFRALGIGVGMHINDWKFRSGHFGNRNLVKGFRPVILQQYRLWRSLLGCFSGVRRTGVGIL